MSIYSKTRIKITVSTVLISLAVIAGAWMFLFTTDYILFKNSMPILFAKTKIEQRGDKRVTIETGLGYYVIMQDDNQSELYVFGHKIN